MISNQMAELAGKAMDLHESSYSEQDCMYFIGLEDACNRVCNEVNDPALGRYLFLSLHWWNDVEEWIKTVEASAAA